MDGKKGKKSGWRLLLDPAVFSYYFKLNLVENAEFEDRYIKVRKEGNV